MKTVKVKAFCKEKIKKGQFVTFDRESGLIRPFKVGDHHLFFGIVNEKMRPSNELKEIEIVIKNF